MPGRKKNKEKVIIKHDRALVNNALRRHLSRLRGPGILCQAMKYAVFSGGKRLRPILVIESSRALKGDTKKALPFACAIELVHNFSLVHDDLPAMDDDDTRRGKPTCHRKFGEGLAILVGDGLLNLAFGILARLRKEKTQEIIFLLSDTVGVRNMIGGQTLDLSYNNRAGRDSKLKNKIDSMKTAALMAASCKIGALTANAKTKDVRRMYEFGKDLGLAFQIADDIEDSAPKTFGLNKRRKEARSLISRAKRKIAPFGKKADTLKYIADSILEKVASSK